jgi:hypothetical protein
VTSSRGPALIVCSAASARAWQRRLAEFGVPSAAWTKKKTWRDDRGFHIRTRGPEDITRCPYDVAIVPPRLAADERESLSERRWGTVVLDGAAMSECRARVVLRYPRASRRRRARGAR